MVTPSASAAKLAIGDDAVCTDAVDSRKTGIGQLQLTLQHRGIGEQEQAFGVDIEPTNGEQARGARPHVGQQVINRGPPLGITVGDQRAQRLVKAVQLNVRRRRQRPVVDRHPLPVVKIDGRVADNNAVNLHPASLDHPLCFTAGAQAGMRDDLGETVAAASTIVGIGAAAGP